MMPRGQQTHSLEDDVLAEHVYLGSLNVGIGKETMIMNHNV